MILTLLLIVIYLAFISLGLPDSLLGSAWPSIYSEMGVPISYAGIISMIISGGTILSSLCSDGLIKKLGTGMVTVISVLMTAAALFGFSLSNGFLQLCLFAIPLGLGAGSVDAALNNYVALHYKARHMSWLHCFWGIGATMGPMVVSFWLTTGQWKMGYRTISIIQFILVVILFAALPLWKKTGAEKAGAEAGEETHAVSLSVKKLLGLPGAKAALTAFFCYCALEATVGLWGSSFLVMSRGIDAKTAARWISMFYFGITFGRFLSGFITFKLSQWNMVRLGQGFIAAGVVLLVIPQTNLFLLPGLFVIGLGCAPIYPSLLHETPDNFGSQYSQSIMGIQMACAYIGSTFMPPLFGFLASRLGYGMFQVYAGLILVFMFVMAEKLNHTMGRSGKRGGKGIGPKERPSTFKKL